MPRISIEEQGLGKTKRKRQKAKLVIKVRNKTWGKEGIEAESKNKRNTKSNGAKRQSKSSLRVSVRDGMNQVKQWNSKTMGEKSNKP